MGAEQELFKVVKVYNHSKSRDVIQENVTEDEAQRIVRSFPDNDVYMFVYTAQ
jgi:uncharacterized protein YabE (DUF348 family)